MAREKQPTTINRCDDCALATWDRKHINTDHEGEPIGLRCPFQQWLIIRGTKACKKFKAR